MLLASEPKKRWSIDRPGLEVQRGMNAGPGEAEQLRLADCVRQTG